MKEAIREAKDLFDDKSSVPQDFRLWTNEIQNKLRAIPEGLEKVKILTLKKELEQLAEKQEIYIHLVCQMRIQKKQPTKAIREIYQKLLNVMAEILKKLDVLKELFGYIAIQMRQQHQDLRALQRQFAQWKKGSQEKWVAYLQFVQILEIQNIPLLAEPAQPSPTPKHPEPVLEPAKKAPRIYQKVEKNIKLEGDGIGVKGDVVNGNNHVKVRDIVVNFNYKPIIIVPIIMGPYSPAPHGATPTPSPKPIAIPRSLPDPQPVPPFIPKGHSVVYASDTHSYFLAEEKTTFALSLPGDHRVSQLVGRFDLSRVVFSSGAMPEPYRPGNIKIPPGWQLALVVGDSMREIGETHRPVPIQGGANNKPGRPAVGVMTSGNTPPISRLEFRAALCGAGLFKIPSGHHPVFVRAGGLALLSEENKPVTAIISGQGTAKGSPVGVMGEATSDSFSRIVLGRR